MTDERNVRQFALAKVFILLFFICVWDRCKIKSAFILSPGDRGWEGVGLIPNCLQKPRKCAFFLGNMRKSFAFLRFWRQRVWGSAAIWGGGIGGSLGRPTTKANFSYDKQEV